MISHALCYYRSTCGQSPNQSVKHFNAHTPSLPAATAIWQVRKLLNKLEVGTTRHHSHLPLATALQHHSSPPFATVSTVFTIHFVLMNKTKLRNINGSLSDKMLPTFIHNFFFTFYESINLVTNMEKAFAKVELALSKVNTLRVLVRVLELLFSARIEELQRADNRDGID